MANSVTMTAEEFTDSVAKQIASQLNIQPDQLVTKLVESLSKGLIDKIVSKTSTQTIKQPTIEAPKPQKETTSGQSKSPITETITNKLPGLLEKISNVSELLSFIIDKKPGTPREQKFPELLKIPLEKLNKQFETTSKAITNIEEIQSDNNGGESDIEAQKQSFLERDDKPKPVLFAGFTPQGLKELMAILPDIINKKGAETLIKQKRKDRDSQAYGNGLGMIGGPGLLARAKSLLPVLATLGGLVSIFYGLQTEGPFKGLAKLVGRGLLSTGKFTKVVNGLITGMIDNLVKLPMKLVKTFGKGLKLAFGKEASGVFGRLVGTGLAKLTGLVPKFLLSALRFLKGAPFIGSLISIGFAVSRFMKGDIIGGGIDVLSGIASLFPGPGTFISYALDALNALLDYKGGGIGEKSKGKGAMIMDWLGGLGKWIYKKTYNLPIIGPAIKMVEAFFVGKWIEGFKQMAFIVPFAETLYNLFSNTTTGNTVKGIAKGSIDWITKAGMWLDEKLSEVPVIGSFIKADKELRKGNWKEALLLIPGMSSIISALGIGKTQVKENEEFAAPQKSIFQRFKEMIVSKLKDMWNGLSGWIKKAAAWVLPTDIYNSISGQPSTTDISKKEPFSTQESTLQKQLENSEFDTKKQFGEKNTTLIDLQKDAQKPEITNNLAIDNKALNKIVENSNKTNDGIHNLAVGFNALAEALKRLGVSIGDVVNKPSTTVINQTKGQNTGAIARDTEFVKVGDPAISNYRRFVESVRVQPA